MSRERNFVSTQVPVFTKTTSISNCHHLFSLKSTQSKAPLAWWQIGFLTLTTWVHSATEAATFICAWYEFCADTSQRREPLDKVCLIETRERSFYKGDSPNFPIINSRLERQIASRKGRYGSQKLPSISKQTASTEACMQSPLRLTWALDVTLAIYTTMKVVCVNILRNA